MSEGLVQKGQVYLANEDKRRFGSIRTIHIERTVMTKRAYDKKRKLYAVAVSRINAHPTRPELIGKKRRVFIDAANLISSEYSLVQVDSFGVAVPPVPDTAESADLATGRGPLCGAS